MVLKKRTDGARAAGRVRERLTGASDPARIADRLHSAAIHLLRRLRVEDASSGLTAPRLSALSVIVFGGPLTLGDLATAEQVRPPTVSRLVRDLVADGLVEIRPDPRDGRVRLAAATERGRKLLSEGRARRVERLAHDLELLPVRDRTTLARAVEILDQVLLPRGRRGEHVGADPEEPAPGHFSGSGSAPKADGSRRSPPAA